MSAPLCDQAFLIQNTGIGANQYMFWASKEACDQWFLGKASGIQISNYSRIYGEPNTRNKRNNGQIVVEAPLDDTMQCDYISYHNTDANRWFHAAITQREFVSDSATRLYFTIDYVATYWDTITFKECFVQRITGEEPVYQNLLAEPLSIDILESPAPGSNMPSPPAGTIADVNSAFNDLSYIVVADIDYDSGEINQPQCQNYCGYPLGGYVNVCPSLSIVQSILQQMVAMAKNYHAKTVSMMSMVQTIICAPTKACMPGDPQSDDVSVSAPAAGKWNKTKNYQYLKIRSGTGEEMKLDPKVFGKADFDITAYYYGGLDGCIRLQLNMGANSVGIGLNSPAWGQVGFGGTASTVDRLLPTRQTGEQMVSSILDAFGAQ